MARGINKVILVGTLGKDPEVKYMPSGGAVANISIATSESWKDKQTGEKKEVTEWHRVVLFNRLAEIAGEYLHKGQQVYIEGSLKTRSWDKDGQKHYATEIVGKDMQMIGGGSGGSNEYTAHQGNSDNRSAASEKSSSAGAGSGYEPDFDDDIPF